MSVSADRTHAHNVFVRSLLTGIVTISLIGCSATLPEPEAISTDEPTLDPPLPTETVTPEVVDGVEVVDEVTQEASATDTIEPLPTTEAPLPEKALSSTGPWLVFLAPREQFGARSLWAINPDGTGLTQLIDEPVLTFDVRPGGSVEQGFEVAYVTGSIGAEDNDHVLNLYSYPQGTSRLITRLLPDDSPTGTDCSYPPTAPCVTYYTIAYSSNFISLKWSPGGGYLAFIGAQWSTTTDVYIYNPSAGLSQIGTDGHHAYNFDWSPDGQYIVYQTTTMETGIDSGPWIENSWAASVDGNVHTSLGTSEHMGAEFIDSWLDSRTVWLVGWNEGAYGDVRAANVETGDLSYVRSFGDMSDAVYSPQYDLWLIAPPFGDGELTLSGHGHETQIPNPKISSVWWQADLNLFIGNSNYDGEVYAISPTGVVSPIEISLPMQGNFFPGDAIPQVSPAGQYWLWHSCNLYNSEDWSMLGIGKPFEQPAFITQKLVQEAIWSLDGQSIIYLAEDGLYRGSAPDFSPILISDAVTFQRGREWLAIWLP